MKATLFFSFFLFFLFLFVFLVSAAQYGQRAYGLGQYGFGVSVTPSPSPSSSAATPATVPVVNDTSNYTWVETKQAPPEQVTQQQGYEVTVSPSQRVEFSVENETHYVGLLNVTNTSAVFLIQSEPMRVTLLLGQEAKFDLNEDEYYDLYLKLRSIKDGNANITIKNIHELKPTPPAAPQEETPAEAPGEVPGEEGTAAAQPTEQFQGSTVAIGIAVVILLILAFLYLRSRKPYEKWS